MKRNWTSIIGWSLWASVCLGLTGTIARAATEAETKEFLAKIQSEDANVRREAFSQAGPFGAAAVVPLGEVANSANRAASLAAQSALKHIAAYAGRPGAAEERKAVAEALTQLLEPKSTKVVSCLALELLSWVGDDAVVPKVAALLAQADPDVSDEARRSLQGIPGAASVRALVDALGKSPPKLKLAIITALGQRGAAEAVDALVDLTHATDTEVVLTALDALARIGVGKDDRVNLPSWENLDPAQRLRLANSFLRWADRRVAKGAVEDALEAYAGIAGRSESEHLVCAALIGAAKAAPDQAFEYLVRALAHQENTVRVTAAKLIEAQSGDDPKVEALLKAYREGKPETRELVLRVLKAWNDKQL